MPFTLRAVLVAAMLLVVPTASAQAAHCPGADAPDASGDARVAAVRCLVSDARVQAGRAPLRTVGSLVRSARVKAGQIAGCGQLSHTPCGASVVGPMRAAGYARGCFEAAENLAWVSSGATPRDVLQAWLDSPDHRATLLSPRYRDTGLARRVTSLSDAGDGEVWVQHFGTHC